MSNKTDHLPRPLIQIDFPAPRDEKDLNLGKQTRALQWFSKMKVTANELGKGRADEYAERMTEEMMEMTPEKLDQLIADFDVLVASIHAAKVALMGGVMLHKLRSMKTELSDIIEEGQGEDPVLEDEDGWFPQP
jgi:hypothetical protein